MCRDHLWLSYRSFFSDYDKDGKNEHEKGASREPNTSLREDEITEQSLPNRTANRPKHSQVKQEKPVIPGLGVYSDSSDSEASSSDSSNEWRC